MRKINCLECQKELNAKPNHKRCKECAKEIKRKYRLTWYKNHKSDKFKTHARYSARHPERNTVQQHHYAIFKSKQSGHSGYKGMIFYDGWNPEKGGSYLAGERWIIENLGKRPEGCTLHIVEHEKGFVPDNLEWTYPRKQNAQQMYKIIADLKHHIKQLEKQIKDLTNQ